MLPIDEMLTDLREKLENLEENKNSSTLDDVFREIMLIQNECENYIADCLLEDE